MIRVSRRKRCPVCDKPDYCSFFDDMNAVICMRVASDKPTQNGGYIHRLNANWTPLPYISPKQRTKVRRDWSTLVAKFHAAMTDDGFRILSENLGLSIETLKVMQIGWDGSQSRYMFPMRNAVGDFVGIRTRRAVPQNDGRDKASFGGDDGHGLFFVPSMLESGYLIVCEGPTDQGALIDAGFGSSIGKPSCKLGDKYVVEIIGRLQPQAVLLIPDSDSQGLEGFSILANEILQSGVMPFEGIDSLVPQKPLKDVRQWLQKNRDHLGGRIAVKLLTIKQRSGGSPDDQTTF